MRPRLLRALAFAAPVAVAGAARAQQATVAEQLYRDAQRLIAAGQVHEACLKFADSERADPALGTLIALAACHEHEGKTGSAWSEFSEAVDAAERQHDATRARYARKHAAALEGRVHRVRIEVTPRVAGMTLELADKTLGEGALGSAIPLDPGDYPLQVRAPHKVPWSRTLHVDASGGDETISVVLVDAPSDPPPAAAPASGPPPSPRAPDVSAPRSSSSTVAALACFGAGAALGVVAVVLESTASAQSSRARDDAGAANAQRDARLYDSAKSEHDDAVATQRWALVAGGVGLAALAVGAYFLVAPGVRVAPAATHGGAGVGVGGAF